MLKPGARMNTQVLIDSIVRQVTVLIAQLATSGGLRAPLAHLANQVFVELANELAGQGVSRKVSADMFGMALRAYIRKVRRLSEGRTEPGRTLWQAVLDFVRGENLTARSRVLSRFARDGEIEVSSVFEESYPVQTRLRVTHEQRGDPCVGFGSRELTLDLTPLAEYYERSYRSKAGLVETNFGLYAFGALSCEDRARAGEAQVAQFEERASSPCTTQDDCQAASFDTRCTRGCGTVIAKEWAREFSRWLSVMDDQVCGDYDGAGCLPLPIFDCGELVVMCVEGRCKHQVR